MLDGSTHLGKNRVWSTSQFARCINLEILRHFTFGVVGGGPACKKKRIGCNLTPCPPPTGAEAYLQAWRAEQLREPVAPLPAGVASHERA